MRLIVIGDRVTHMTVLTSDEIKTEFLGEYTKLLKEHGDPTHIPKDSRFYINERMRARYCVLTNPTWTPEQIVSYYSIDKNVALEVFGVDKESVSKKPKRSDKYEAIKKWCAENVFAEVTTTEIADIGEISYQTALKYIADNPHTFRKVGRGKYEVRDPKADREAGK